MEKTRKWRKILAMMLTVVMMLQNAQSVMVFADVTNEQIEQRLAGNQGQTEETQPAQSQVDTRANGEEYKTQSQETQENGNGSTDIGSPESGNATTEAKTSNADVSATITQSVFQADVSGTTCNFVQMTAQITNNDAENPATGVSVKALLNSAQLSWVNGYGTETAGAGAYAVDSNNTADLPDGSADGYNQIVMWTDQTIGAGETVAYQFAAQIIPENLDGVVNAWYVDGTSCSYTWENTEILVPTQAPVEPAPEVAPPQTEPEEKPEVKPEETTPEVTEAPEVTPTPEVAEVPEATPTPEVTEVPEATPTPEVTEVPEATPTPEQEEEEALKSKKKEQERLLTQKARAKAFNNEKKSVEDNITVIEDRNVGVATTDDRKDIANNDITFSFEVNGEPYDSSTDFLDRNATIDIKMTYIFKAENQPTETDCLGYYYDLPNLDHLEYDLPENGIIKGDDGTAGSWVRNGNRIIFNYDSEYIHGHPEEGYGTFHIWSKIDKESVTKIDKFPITLGGQTTYINLKNTPLTGNKTYSVDTNGNLVFKIVLTASDADAENVVVTDTLTGNLQFMGTEHFTVRDSHDQIISGWNVEINGQTATISGLKVEKGNPITIEYLVNPNTSGNSKVADTNTASWTWGDGTGDGQKSDTTGSIDIDLDNNKLTKSGTVNINQNQIDYVVNINEFGLQLLPTPGGFITVTDTISDENNQVGLEIIRSSIKLFDKSGHSISTAIIEYSPTELKIKIPDATAAVLTYTVQMSGIPDVTKGRIKNVAKIEGEEEKEVTTENDVVIVKASATYDGVAKTVKIKKFGKYLVDGEYPSLSGAKFALYQCIAGSEDKLLDTQETVNGTLQFKNVATGTLYYIKEVVPPNGYQVDETPIYFATYAKAAEKDTIQAKIEKDFPHLVGKILYKKDGLVLEIEDEPVPEPDSLTIEADKTVKGQQTVEGSNFSFNMKFVKYQPLGKFVKGEATERYNVQENASTYDDTKNNVGGKISFVPITFGYEGVYTFEVNEIQTNPDKYFYDETVYEVKVTVTNINGHLTATKEVIPNAHNDNKITFNNIEKTTFTLQKNTGEKVKKDTTFNFTLSSTDSDLDFRKVEYEDSDNIVESFIKKEKSATLVLKVKKGTNISEITFKNLPVGAKIKVEENNLQAGWHLSANEPYSPGQEITLVSTASNNKVTVTNEYKEDGSVVFEVSKKFNDWRNGQNFTFKLQGLSMEGDADSRLKSIPMPKRTSVNVTNDSPANGDVRTVQFGDISYTVNGKYYYLLKEDNIPSDENRNGITYDSSVTYIKVEVTDGTSGKKTVNVFTTRKNKAVDDDSYTTFTMKSVDGLTASAEFENTYKASTQIQFKGTKTIAGRDIKNTDVFTFEVSGGNLKTPVTVNNDGADINFAPITFTQDDLKGESSKEFTFEIRETGTPSKGITFDPDIYEVKVVVTKNDDGTLSAAVKDAGEPENGIYILPNKNGKTATFVNTYGASAKVILTATKTIDNRSLKDKEFTFKISGDGLGENGKEVKNAADGTIEFPIDYTLASLGDEKEKTFTYTVEEVDGNSKNGVTYDKTRYTVKVKVSDNGSGELKAEVIEGAKKTADNKYAISLPTGTDKKANFENTYNAQTTIQFTGRKVLNNKALNENEFEFEISGPNIGNGAPVKVKNDKNGNIEFPEITYTLTDLLKNGNDYGSNRFEYKIKEVDSKQPGITYDDTEYTVTVMVTNNNTGTLTTTVKMGTKVLEPNSNTDNKIYSLTGDKATFINEYGAKETSVSFAGIKELQNRALKGEDFTFSISGIDGTVYSSEIKNDKDGNIKFNPITYKLSDLDKDNDGNYTKKVFNYVISEKSDIANPGVTYSDKVYYAKVTVTNEKGELVKKVEIGTKDVEGNINYSEVKENSDGNYLITPEGTATFTNIYHAETTVQFKGTKALVDTLGNSKGVSGRKFEFEISDPKLGENGVDGTKTVSVKDDGTFEFPAISYDVTDLDKKNGDYTSKSFNYTIKEVIPEDAEGTDKNVKGGVTYDKTSYNVVVTITNNIKTGTLTQKVQLAENSPEGQKVTGDNGVYTLSAGENKATFTNRYDATTKYTFTVEKQLAGRKFKDGDNFRFALLKGRTELQTIELKVGGENGVKVETDENGNQYLVGTFDAQEYGLSDVGKSYEYTIRELNPKKAMDGVTTDEDIYIVDVAITDNGDGTLKAEPKRVLGDKDKGETKVTFDKAVFTNKYQAEGTALIVGKKFLSPGEIGEEKFEFTLSQLKEDGTTTILQKKENIGNVIEFDSIPYKTEDEGKTFWYIVQETTGTNQKYAYDNSVYKVKVVVSMDPKDNRKLIANQTIYDITGKQLSESGEEAKAIVFTNRYEAAGSITLTGKKVVEGTDKLKAGEFKFKVKEGVGENAKVVATGTNDENGNITFSEISYAYNSKNNDLGEHVYTVTEVQPKDGDGYVYDLTSRKIVVKVTDNQDKTLKAEIIAASEKDAELKSDVTNNVINSFINKQISITIRKNDANKARLADAELALFEYDNEKKAKTGDAIDTWTTSKDNDHTITGKLVAGKTYILEETKAPDGYAEANPIIFTIKNDGVRTIEVVSGGQLDETGKVLIMVDQKTGVQILKVDEKGKGVPGAELAIFDGDKQIGASWTTDGQAHVIEGLTAGKTYTLKELKAPSGYKKAEDKTFTIDASKVVEVRMEDKTIKLSIMKIDENGQGLKGADLEIRNKNNELIDKWTSETTEHVVDEEKSRKLVEGEEYTLIETKAPEGYALANPKTFTIKSSETVTKVTMENVPNSVIISKKSLTGIESIGGAKLRVLDPQGNEVVKTWTTEKGKDKAVTGVFKPNVTYTLEEVEAPEGYRKAANIMFSLNETGELYVGNTKVTSVVMRDALTKASILKVDESGKGIAGADLVIKDSKGNIKATWTSDGTPHAVEGVLKVGETYTLSETKAPSGYTVAPDQTFKMEDKDVVEVTMVDYPASGSGQITVTKKVTFANGGDSLDLIAQDDTFYVNLFTDAAGKYPYKGAKPQAIHLVNASAGSVTFSDLAQGTYYVYETDANGNVINLDQEAFHNGTQFMCTVNGGSNTVKLDLKAGPKEGVVNLENVFYDIPTGYSYKAEININKQVLKGTSQTTVDDTFYAGIFTKDDQGVYNLFTVVPLVQNDTVTVEVPLGGEDGTEPINYYILETDADGNILDLDVFEYEVTGEGTVALSKDNLAGNINLVNKIPEDTDGKLRVQKTDGNGVGLAGASFRLTDEDGSVIDEWTSEASAHELELEPGTYTLTEVQAPTGYTGAGSVTIKVDDDYNFSVSGEIDYSYKGGLLKIVNKATTSTPSSGTPVSGGSTPASYSSALSGKVAVKTGDNTPIGAYAAVLVIAALAIAGGIFYKKKRKNDK